MLGESTRNHFIPSLVTDFTWGNQIAEKEREELFIAEKVFLSLKSVEVKQVILFIQQRFPNPEFFMEFIGKFILNSTQIFRFKAIPGGRFQWEIND